MRTALTLIASEILKLRRTLALWMVVIAPMVVVLLQILLWMNQKEGIGFDADLWIMFTMNIFSMWSIFMFPLFCALVVALLYHYEHTTSGWQKLYTLPVPKWSVLAAKQAAAVLLLLASGIVLCGGTIAAGFVVDALHPAIDMPREIPFGYLIPKWCAMTGASLLILSIQHWASLRWTTLSVPIGVGIAGTFAAMFASSWKYGHFYPWLMPLHVLHKTDGSEITALWTGFAGGLCLHIVMTIVESRRDITA
jgi:ABC-2 type transport system permease protein